MALRDLALAAAAHLPPRAFPSPRGAETSRLPAPPGWLKIGTYQVHVVFSAPREPRAPVRRREKGAMRLRSTWVALLLCCQPHPVFAQWGQLFLNHDDCTASIPRKNRNLDCTDPTARSVVVASTAVVATADDVISDDGIIDVAAGADPDRLPEFWQFNFGGCGGGYLVLSPDFTAGYANCLDLWQGRAHGGGNYGGVNGPVPEGRWARIRWSWAVDPETPALIYAGAEYYVCRVTFLQSHLPRCSGCSSPVCMVYGQEVLFRANGELVRIQGLDWVAFNDPNDLMGCWRWFGPVPVQPGSWGRLKALYR